MRSDARFVLRDATLADAPAIADLHIATMRHAYENWIGARVLAAMDLQRCAICGDVLA
jgi:hypothetical protein